MNLDLLHIVGEFCSMWAVGSSPRLRNRSYQIWEFKVDFFELLFFYFGLGQLTKLIFTFSLDG